VRLAFSALIVVLAFTEGCGYVGPVLPPSPEIPTAVTNLIAVERGDQVEVSFTTPALTTDFLQVKGFAEIELRAGPGPFDGAKWAASAKRYQPASLPSINADDPQPVAVKVNIPVSDWQGQAISIAVRTAVKPGDHFSRWSAPANVEVIEPLPRPKVSAEATSAGYKLHWMEERSGVEYQVLREGPGAAPAVPVGTSEKPEFVDTTAQWDVPYNYFVIATKGGAESLRSQGVSVNHPDTFPPSVPQGLTALAGPTAVELTWSRSPQPDLKLYRIYRGVGSAPLEPFGEPTNLPTFSDAKVEHGKTYRYAVTAIDNKDNESEKSAIAEVAF
jgi:fibronectin type 3 domain-containing protein